MQLWVAAIFLLLLGAPAVADETAAALSRVPAALDGAEAAFASCPQPETAIRGRKAVLDARAFLAAARTNPGVMLILNEKMELIRSVLETCVQFKKIAEEYRSKCQGEVRLGMSAAQVRQSLWCQPTKIMTTETPGHRREEWIYTANPRAAWLGRPEGFLYFTDGKLTSIERAATP